MKEYTDFEQELTDHPEPSRGKLTDLNSCIPELTLQQRIAAFVVFTAIGYVLQIGSFSKYVSSLFEKDPMHFSLVYSFGNVLSLIGLFFLVGFHDQLKLIAHENRRTVSIVYFGSMLLCLILPFVLQNSVGKILVAVFVLIQMISYWWYTLSYLPWARECIGGCFNCIRRII